MAILKVIRTSYQTSDGVEHGYRVSAFHDGGLKGLWYEYDSFRRPAPKTVERFIERNKRTGIVTSRMKLGKCMASDGLVSDDLWAVDTEYIPTEVYDKYRS